MTADTERLDELRQKRLTKALTLAKGNPMGLGDAIGKEGDRRAAKAFHDAQERAEEAAEIRGRIPAPVSLTDLLAEPLEDASYRVQGLLPTGGRGVLVAARKTGKTTMTGNFSRSLADGDPFLGHFDTGQVNRVAILDFEMSRGQIRRWMADQGIKNTGAIEVHALRGEAATFDILDPATRTFWANRIGPVDVVILDCLRPVLDALKLNEHTEAGRFLVAFDALLAEAEISEAVLVHHSGHGNDRARGDSRIEDWPDAIWYLGTDDRKDPNAARTFSAIGRDVDVASGGLEFDPDTRHLTFVQAATDAAKTAKSREVSIRRGKAAEAVGEYVRTQNGIGIEPTKTEAARDAGREAGVGRDEIRSAITALVVSGELVLSTVGRSHHLRAVDPTQAIPLKPENPFGKPTFNQVNASAGIGGPETPISADSPPIEPADSPPISDAL